MNQDLESLIVLQAQDLDLARLRSELEEAPRRVQAAEAALQAAQRSVENNRASLLQEEKLRRDQERDIASHKSKTERLRRSLDTATSAAQVTAFEHELAFAAGAIGNLEDQELASMERTEALEQQLREADTKLRQAEEQLASERSRAAHTRSANDAAIAGIEEQRSALRAQIEPTRLSQYDRLRKAKGTAVAEALGNATQGKCSACQMGVRPQRWQDLTGREHDDQIFTCESCGRMLFWDPRRDTPKPWEAGERLRHAQSGSAR
jgi:uncharacterized protein